MQLLGGPDSWPEDRQCNDTANPGEADVLESTSGFPFLELVSLSKNRAGGTR